MNKWVKIVLEVIKYAIALIIGGVGGELLM